MSKIVKGIGLLGTLACTAGGAYYLGKNRIDEKEEEEQLKKNIRLDVYYDIMTCWMELNHKGISIGDSIVKKGYKKVAIYGHGKIGILFYDEICASSCKCLCFIDAMTVHEFRIKDDVLCSQVEHLENYQDADAIIVTPAFAIKDITKELQKQGYEGEIIGLNVLLHDI